MNAATKWLQTPGQNTEPAPFSRLRSALVRQGYSSMRMIYAVLEGEYFATLTAEPTSESSSPGSLDHSILSQLQKAFRRWMLQAHGDWRRGVDCTGYINWDLGSGRFAHRHGGYAMRWCRGHERGA
jgi:hypothetical protein